MKSGTQSYQGFEPTAVTMINTSIRGLKPLSRMLRKNYDLVTMQNTSI